MVDDCSIVRPRDEFLCRVLYAFSRLLVHRIFHDEGDLALPFAMAAYAAQICTGVAVSCHGRTKCSPASESTPRHRLQNTSLILREINTQARDDTEIFHILRTFLSTRSSRATLAVPIFEECAKISVASV